MEVDPSYIARLWDFLWEVLSAWFVQVTGVILVIEQFLEFILPKKWWNKIDTEQLRAKRKHILRWLCAVAFIYASFSAYDDVNKRLRVAQEQSRSEPGFSGLSTTSSIRRITIEQKEIISNTLYAMRPDLSEMIIGVYYSDDNIFYATSLINAITISGIAVSTINMAPDNPTQTGVMLSCKNPQSIPESAIKLKKVLLQANIPVHIIGMLSRAEKYNINGCMLFIGPSPS